MQCSRQRHTSLSGAFLSRVSCPHHAPPGSSLQRWPHRTGARTQPRAHQVGTGAWLHCLTLTPTVPYSRFSPSPRSTSHECTNLPAHLAATVLGMGRRHGRRYEQASSVFYNTQPKQSSVQAFILLLSPPFCSGFQEREKGGNMFRRKPPCSQCLHTVLLNQSGTMPSLGKNKACASLLGAEFDKSSAANLAALAYY